MPSAIDDPSAGLLGDEEAPPLGPAQARRAGGDRRRLEAKHQAAREREDERRRVGAAVGTFVAVVGSGVGTGVGKIVGTVVSSSRRAPRRPPLDRRAFGPLRGGCCCPHANALRSTHRPRRSMLRALLSPLVCPEALLGTPSRRWLPRPGAKPSQAER